MSERYIVIMAGGRGERFWPLSRTNRPKHLLPVVGHEAMLRQTLDRIGNLVPKDRIMIITNREQESAIRELCPDLDAGNIVAEPIGRDTAAAVALAALVVRRKNPDATFAMLPADHVIHDQCGFRDCLADAFRIAESSAILITVGVSPTHAATGYGYIERGEALPGWEDAGAYVVRRFVEKPDQQRAESYLKQGTFYWNAGMFVWQVKAIEASLKTHCGQLFAAMGVLSGLLDSGRSMEDALDSVYPDLPRISIDFAVMEKAAEVATLSARFDWDDVGEWPAVARHCEADAAGNALVGHALVRDGKGNLVFNDGARVTALLGVEDLIVVHTADATLVCHKSRAQEIKAIVKALEADVSGRAYV
jgi:mannose-1-phosphate guanylyltransferase